MQRLAKKMIRTGCIAVAALVGASFATASSAQTQSDGLIVRNERIGAVSLGAPLADVVAALGQPTSTVFLGQRGMLTYADGTPNAYVMRLDTWGPRNEVYAIAVGTASRGYATPEGLAIGMSEVDVRVRLGNPDHRIWLEDGPAWQLVYAGLDVLLTPDNRVMAIGICHRRYQRRGTSFWCPPPD